MNPSTPHLAVVLMRANTPPPGCRTCFRPERIAAEGRKWGVVIMRLVLPPPVRDASTTWHVSCIEIVGQGLRTGGAIFHVPGPCLIRFNHVRMVLFFHGSRLRASYWRLKLCALCFVKQQFHNTLCSARLHAIAAPHDVAVSCDHEPSHLHAWPSFGAAGAGDGVCRSKPGSSGWPKRPWR